MKKEKIFFIGMFWLGCLILSILLTSCGVTKATISRPAEGTSTTITITTNNPITTNVDPTIDAVYKPSK